MTVLHPYAALTRGSDGNFYGTTAGSTDIAGTVSKSPERCADELYSFIRADDGASPYAGLAPGSDGNFYGTPSAT